VRVLRILAVLTAGAAGSLVAQLAAPQPTEKLLVLPLSVANPADSAASIATMDAARARIISLARYKVNVIPKAKLCEVLQQSGFACDVLITPQQAEQLSKALGINSYTGGVLTHTGNLYIGKVHIVSGASGFASTFTINGGATPTALGEAIAQRLNNIVKAAEFARNCNDQRSHNALDRALVEARKAFAIEPNLAEAWACIASVHEVKRSPTDSMIQAYRGALKGDSANSGVWSRLANLQMARGDTDGALGTYAQELLQNPTDKNLRLALAGQQLQRKKYVEALALVDDGLKVTPGDQQLSDLRKRIGLDGAANASDTTVLRAMSHTLLAILRQEATSDTAKLADTNNLKLAIGTAQKISDTTDYLWWSRAAVRHYPTSVPFMKQLAGAFLLAGQTDSAIAIDKNVLAANPNDVQTSLLVAKTIVDGAVWDTSKSNPCQIRKDTECLRRLREPFIAKINPARPLLGPGYAAADSGLKLTAYVVGLTGGSKLAQAGAYDDAYVWLDQLLGEMGPVAGPGPKEQIRTQASFWFGISSAITMQEPYKHMVDHKSCEEAKTINDRINRGIAAIDFGGRVAPGVAAQMRGIFSQYAGNMPKVRQAFHCTNF
jgi:tetratricopeptide (TPR) repeat protein